MRKGEILSGITIESVGAEGNCIAKIDGKVLFLKGGAPGDIVEVKITKVKSSFLEGQIVKINTESDLRVHPFCSHYGTCGGCSFQHLNYETQLFYKQKQVVDNLERIGGLTLPQIQPILPSAKTQYYRNRLDFTFTFQRWLSWQEMQANVPFGEPGLGFHIPKMFDKVFDVKECYLLADPSNAIRLAVKDEAINHKIPFFDLRKQTGFLRTLTLRIANTGEIMIILQVANDTLKWVDQILSRLENEFPQITSFNYIVNTKRNDTFQDQEIICWKGNPYITEQMKSSDGTRDLQFRVGAKSFYQTNSDQAYELYKVAADFAGLTGDERVYDLYTGTGTIANFVAGKCKEVIGLEYVSEAIEDAKVNSTINNITNTKFFAGDIKDLLDDAFLKKYGKPDVVITDPPRAGMHEDVCRMLLKAAPQKIVYVSCNPATQARDLKILAEDYTIQKVRPVDMFPHTMHVENVVLLTRHSER